MTSYALQIMLQSPLTSAAGEGRVGLVDRDVAFDELGLPILPGRRLKGLWREAYRDVADAWTSCGESPIPTDRIFGKAGQKPGDGDACLYIANAELREASSLKPWLRYLHHPKIQKLHPDDVVQHFSTVRAQTAIDRRTGAARENTLRLTRTLRAGLVFRAPLRFVEPPADALKNALALGAAALQYMGTARTRGLGKVCCRLLECNASGRECDLTEQALASDALPSIIATASSSFKPSSKMSEGQATRAPCSKHPFPTHLLRYRLTLTAPAVIPVADGDPNTVVTRQDVPGSHILGAAAWHYLRQPHHTPEDDAFRHAFLDRGLRFLTAYPEADDPDEFDEPLQRMIPIPHSIRKFKENESLVDFVEQSPRDATKRFDRRYAKIERGSLKTQAVKTERNYHHARADDRRKGRALENDGAFFRYEAIQADQKFQGAVLGSKDDLNALQAWLHGVQSIGIGRSRNAQYGEAKFEWIDDTPQNLNRVVEWDGFVERQDDGKNEPQCLDGCLIVTTLSPLLTINDNGHPDARFPERELADALDIDTSELILSRSYTRTEVIGGYHTHLRLPRQQWPAIASGSVFVFCTKKALDGARLLQLEHDGLGLRKGEGYGRIAVNRQKALGLTGCEIQLDDPKRQDHPNAPAEVPQSIQELLRGVVRMRCLADMQQRAMDVARAAKNIPSNAQLGRLRLFLQQDSPADSLENLRDPAEKQLTSCEINTRSLPWLQDSQLYDLFKKAWTNPKTLTKELIKDQVEEIARDFDDDTRKAMIDELVNDHSNAMCREFLDHLLTALRRKDRK